MMLKAPLKASAQLLHGDIVCIAVLLQSNVVNHFDSRHLQMLNICNIGFARVYHVC